MNTNIPSEKLSFTRMAKMVDNTAYKSVQASLSSSLCYSIIYIYLDCPFLGDNLPFKRQTLNPLSLKDFPKVVCFFPVGISKCKEWEKCKVLILIISAQNQLEV